MKQKLVELLASQVRVEKPTGFASSLNKLKHLHVYIDSTQEWTYLHRDIQDLLVECIRGNPLKSLKLKRLVLPRNFVSVLPSSLEAFYTTTIDMVDDPTFVSRYLEAENQLPLVAPSCLRIGWLDKPESSHLNTWEPSQASDFYRRLASLDVGIRDVPMFMRMMDIVPGSLSKLSVQHRGYRLGELGFPVSNV